VNRPAGLWTTIKWTPAYIVPEEDGRHTVAFRLLYEGQLLSSNTGNGDALRRNKHAIRKQLHKQLKAFWETNHALQHIKQLPDARGWSGDMGMRTDKSDFTRGGINFIPLVSTRFHLVCSLDILFLRREPPGAVVQGGDVDNRINTLFDALRIPEGDSDITEGIAEDEKPFYCLLQDDRLVTELKVTTDRLFRPTPEGHAKNDVVLVIAVELEQTTKLW
jgi:hypothetical protein